MNHVELHFCPTAKDAARLEYAGLPRYDLHPEPCGSCSARTGEVLNRDGESVAWKPFAVVVWDTGLDVLCNRCLKPVDKVLTKR